jgi:hypothetical protein
MGSPLRGIDIDVGEARQAPSAARLWRDIPLPIAAAILIQTGGIVYWAAQQSTKLDTMIMQQQEFKTELYRQVDATRDLALRDDRIVQLERRIASLEQVIDGRHR